MAASASSTRPGISSREHAEVLQAVEDPSSTTVDNIAVDVLAHAAHQPRQVGEREFHRVEPVDHDRAVEVAR